MPLKIAVIIGTRPEIIKMAPVIDELEKRMIEYVLIHTGQHYDREMSDQFFLDLELRKPHYNIGVGSGTHGEQTATMIKGLEQVLMDEKPDLVLVQGDTNAVLSGAIVSSKLHIPVGHVEAGLRSYDKTMPEEINREVADVCSKMFFVPTEESAINLILAGIKPKDIFITGNTIVDACMRNLDIAKKKAEMPYKLDKGRKILTLTMHRAENVDNKTRLQNIVDALIELEEVTIIFPAHPRTIKNLNKYDLLSKMEDADHIELIKPIGYLNFLLLLSKSEIIMTDSGGLQEEAITLNIPCTTLRYNTERPETVEAGGNILIGAEKEKIVGTVKEILDNKESYSKMSRAPNPYGDGRSSVKILDAILKLYKDDELEMKVPHDIMKIRKRQIIEINEDITVSDFEKKGAEIRMVFEGGTILFPHRHLNLKDKMILMETLT